MSEGGVWPATACGDALRAAIAGRRKRMRRQRIAVVALMAALPCAMTMFWRPQVALVWNASASAPRGLYRLYQGEQPGRGDWAVASLPSPMRKLAAARGYLPASVPLVKRVAAVKGDRVCANRDRLTINGRLVAVRKRVDALARPLPAWRGCEALRAGDVFLLGEHPWSFDGRYFGVTRAPDIAGRAALVWQP